MFLLLTGWLVLLAQPVLALDFGWTAKTPMPTPRTIFASAVVNSKIYAIGGLDANYIPLKTVEEYDPATDTWTTKADMPTARGLLGAGVVNNKIYVIGGRDASSTDVATVEEYDPALDSWTAKTDMPTAREGACVGVANNKIYVIGGYDNSATILSTVEEYSPAGDTWATKPSIPNARGFGAISVISNIIYLMAGEDSSYAFVNTVGTYDPATGIWTDKADMLTSQTGCRLGVINNIVYAIGGIWFDPIKTVEAYDVAGNSWESKSDFPYNISDLEVQVVNGKLYAISGGDALASVTNSVEEGVLTNPPALSWTGEANYTSDGLDPEVGYSTNTFTFRINYTDADNDAPNTGYPKLHLLKDSVEITGSPFSMTAVTPGDVTYTDGKLYTKDITGLSIGNTYTYYFEAADINNAITNTSTLSGPTILSHVPTLTWTGESGYTTGGISLDSGRPSTTYVFRVQYTDQDNAAPLTGYPRLHIKKANVEITGSPFAMTAVTISDTTYTDGKLYTYSVATLAVGSDYTYYFDAQDVYGTAGTGTPASSSSGPTVINSAPSLSWAGSTNYTNSGVYPSTGTPYTNFVFRVKYTDSDNDAPKTAPRVHIKKNNTEITNSPFTMGAADASDTIYTDGKIYSYSITNLAAGTDYTYYFDGSDLFDTPATGNPITPISAPQIVASEPDLVITGITNDWTAKLSTGSDLEFIFTVTNQGEADIVQDYKINIYISQDKNLNNAVDLGKYSKSDTLLPRLSYGNSSTSNIKVFVPATVAAGDYYLGVKIDPDNEVAEENENNNLYWSVLPKTFIVGSADGSLAKAFCYPSPANLANGERINFAQFTPRAEVRILSTAGYIVKEFIADDNGYIPAWDGRVDSGEKLASGLYIVHAHDDSSKVRMFKIVIVN